MTAGFSSLNEMGESPYRKLCRPHAEMRPFIPRSLFFPTEECCDLEESPGSLLPSESSSNGAVEDSGLLWGSLGSGPVSAVGSSCQGPAGPVSGVGYQDSARRCSQRKKSDMLLLGCASLLASVAFGQDLLQLGKLQVRVNYRHPVITLLSRRNHQILTNSSQKYRFYLGPAS